MEKIFCSDDFPEVLEASDTGRANFYFDASDKMTKSASAAVTRELLQSLKPPSHMQGVHVITMGAEEDYGFNRNADSASRKSLAEHHPTFMKYGSVYREHNNKDRKHSIGDIKFEVYNPEARRGELVLWFDKDKAPDMAEKAANQQELSWSMSMRLPFDRCSICDNKAKTRKFYCSHLKRNLRNYDGQHQKYAYARNEDGVKFVDISEVKKRADRIASTLAYFGSDELNKAASADSVIGGAEWFEMYRGDTSNAFVSVFELGALNKIASAMCEIPSALSFISPTDLAQEQIEVLRNPDFRNVVGELNKRAMILSPRTFASIVSGEKISDIQKDATFDDAIAALPEIIQNMLRQEEGCCTEDLGRMISPDACGCSLTADGDSIDRLLADVGENLGMNESDVCSRAANTAIVVKVASEKNRSGERELWDQVAGMYALYLTKAATDLSSRIPIHYFAHLIKDVSV